jgi:diguanylate cyclase (GGDEF)-like protein
MTSIIDTVAALTYLRDRDALEAAFCRAIFELSEADSLAVWRIAAEDGGLQWHRRLRLPEKNETAAPISWINAPLLWQECHITRRFIKTPATETELARLIFPLGDSRRVAGLLEIKRPRLVNPAQAQLVDGLVQVYLNHLSLLDYGARDELTGLLNRRMFNEYFRQVSVGHHAEAAIAVIDIDHFKRINDQFGHPYGDEVLVLLGRMIEQHFSRWEGIFRFGGEEFVIILSGASLDAAAETLEAFRATVYATRFPTVGEVTVSIGFAAVRPTDNGSAAFGRADQALYVAKRSGRNQVQCFDTLADFGVLEEAHETGGEAEFF